ncbi:hypothetical protein PCCS19_47500 [Paenibacillus sp. CCS19]|uniref:hypothetical protein n=1 Tax=Paenibacillus sp. CCS19 TaxID=3158387 RepID=UPI0025606EBE|nr:hypothetical protein [Paenibacillus cellulosilyticus]GMK41693.1 hypothetical protein PCCS19_47500 [Paenibacillus cellulosilyticus]
MIIGIVVTRSHLVRAKALAQSIKRFNPEVKVVVSLLERYNMQDISMYPHFDEVVLASQTWLGDFNQAIFKYNAREASSFSRALLIDYLFNRYPNENQIVLLDSDMEVLAPLQDLRSRLEECSILLTPRHLRTGAESDDTRVGVYNAGLVGVSRTPSGLAFAQWWMQRLERYSFLEYDDETKKLLAEQKWLNQVPVLFDGVQVLKHAGYNVADWNYDERDITQNGGSHYLANGETLYIKHYHRVEDQEKEASQPEYASKRPVLAALIKQYVERLDALGWDRTYSMPWSYQFFASGEPIQDSTRMLYRNNLFLEQEYPNPYELSNEFFEWGMFGEVPPVIQSQAEPMTRSVQPGVLTLFDVPRRKMLPHHRITKKGKKSRSIRKRSRSRSSDSLVKSIREAKDSSVKKQWTWSFSHRRAAPLLIHSAKLRRRAGSR